MKWNSYHNKGNAEMFSHEILPGENNLYYFAFSPNSEKPIKAVIHHIPPENISNSLEDLGFNVINVRQMTAIRRAPKGQTHVELLPLFLVTLTRNIKSQEP
jgi:hypothetical protein